MPFGPCTHRIGVAPVRRPIGRPKPRRGDHNGVGVCAPRGVSGFNGDGEFIGDYVFGSFHIRDQSMIGR